MEEIYELNAKVPQKESKIKDTRLIGARGEYLATSALMEGRIFDCECIGGNMPVFDLLLKINDDKYPYFAAVQVKTRSEIIAKNGKFNIEITQKGIDNLVRLGLPTYLIGVEESTLNMYLVPVFNKVKTDYIKGIPITYTLNFIDHEKNIENLVKLKNDIIAYSTPISKRKLLYKTKLKFK